MPNIHNSLSAISSIDENKRLQALLNDNPLQRAIFNSANFSIIATDANGVIQIFNVGAERMLGYTSTEVVNKITPADISDSQEVVVRAEALTLELGTQIEPGFDALVFKSSRGIEDIYELTYIRKDGSRFPAVVSVTALRDEAEIIIGYLLIGTDNTERKKAEEALLKAGALQRAIFSSANFSMIATDAKGVIQIFNVGAERMLGYTATEVMNKITPADISDSQEVVTRAEALTLELGTQIEPGFDALVFKASRGIEDIYELTYIRKDGSRFPAVVSVTALRDAQENIIGYLLIGTDNTERKKDEKILKDNEVFKKAILNSLAAEIAVIDQEGIIREVNVPWQRFSANNTNPNEPLENNNVGLNYLSYCHAANSTFLSGSDVYHGIRSVLDGHTASFSMEYPNHTQTQQRWYTMSVLPLGQEVISGAVIAHTDISEYKRLDQILQEKNVELENARFVADEANQAKSDFLSSMSHELRSPLNAILGFAQLMETDVPPPSEFQEESIVQILQAGWHLLTLINEILDLAKIESRQVPLHLEPISLASLMLECQGMIEPQAQQRGITVNFPTCDIPTFVSADRTRVKQIMINLLSNAIKYNSLNGTVDIKFSERTAGHILVSVKDTGAGLSAEQLAQLFQPFNRLGQEAGNEEGTGIGLVVAKRLVELMGGSIGVESIVDVGSVFWFELASVVEPQLVQQAINVTANIQQAESIEKRLKTLLYVEDNPANMKLLENIISRYPDIQLLKAVDGLSGVEIARTALPDVILMDINLPGINGFEALSILRANTATTHIPVIALSANAMPLDIEKGLKADFFRYITKPIRVNELMSSINLALETTERYKPY